VFRVEIQDPIGLDKLIAKINVRAPEGALCPIEAHDPIGAHEHQYIAMRCRLTSRWRVRFLLGDSILHLFANPISVQRIPVERHFVRMKQEAVRLAFDIHRLAIVAAFAQVRDERVSIFLALAQRFDACQRLFQLLELGGLAGQLAPRGITPLLGFRDGGLLAVQDLATCEQPALPDLDLVLQRGHAAFLGFDLDRRFLHLPFGLFHFADQFLNLVRQGRMKLFFAQLPLAAVLGRHALGLGDPLVQCFVFFGGLGAKQGGLLLGLLQRGNLGAPVHDHEQEDQRAHCAQQHCQKWKRADTQCMPAPFHAAFPVRPPRRLFGCPAAPTPDLAVRRWIAAVRLWTASSKAPAPCKAARF
jgi:hypothetical protein